MKLKIFFDFDSLPIFFGILVLIVLIFPELPIDISIALGLTVGSLSRVVFEDRKIVTGFETTDSELTIEWYSFLFIRKTRTTPISELQDIIIKKHGRLRIKEGDIYRNYDIIDKAILERLQHIIDLDLKRSKYIENL